MKKEQERQEANREAEEIERLRDLHLWEQSMNERKKLEEKGSVMKAYQVRRLLNNIYRQSESDAVLKSVLLSSIRII